MFQVTLEWDVVLDLDALAEDEDEDWVWKGSSCLRPEYRQVPVTTFAWWC